MKKITLILILTLALFSCSIENDEPNVSYSPVGILDATLPEYFVIDQEYEIDITYDLGSDCNSFHNFEYSSRQDPEDNSVLEFYVNAIVSFDPSNTANCTDDGITETENWAEDFAITSDQYDTIRFNFLSGRNADGTPDYLTIDVLVGEPDENEEPTE